MSGYLKRISMSNHLKPVITIKLFLVSFFFSLAPLMITICGLFLLKDISKPSILGATISPVGFVNHLYAALPPDSGEFSLEIKTGDARCLLIEKYLKKYSSPLIPYAKLLCDTADKYGLDYRLMVAIAQQESNLCKTSPPEWYNCWGWGIHSKGIKTYGSYEEAINDVARGLKERYCDKGYCQDPCLMMKKYTPRSSGSWCFGIKKFLAEIEEGV